MTTKTEDESRLDKMIEDAKQEAKEKKKPATEKKAQSEDAPKEDPKPKTEAKSKDNTPDWIAKGKSVYISRAGLTIEATIEQVKKKEKQVKVKAHGTAEWRGFEEIVPVLDKEDERDLNKPVEKCPTLTKENFRVEWEKRYPRLAYGAKRPRYDVIENLCNCEAVTIMLPSGQDGSPEVEQVRICGQVFSIPRDEEIIVPMQIKEMLLESGHLHGIELRMHTNAVRRARRKAEMNRLNQEHK